MASTSKRSTTTPSALSRCCSMPEKPVNTSVFLPSRRIGSRRRRTASLTVRHHQACSCPSCRQTPDVFCRFAVGPASFECTAGMSQTSKNGWLLANHLRRSGQSADTPQERLPLCCRPGLLQVHSRHVSNIKKWLVVEHPLTLLLTRGHTCCLCLLIKFKFLLLLCFSQ